MTDDDRSPHNGRSSNEDERAADVSSTAAPAEERFLRIDEVARRTNLTKRTLRYYEELGLLEPAQRSEGNYRLYSESDVQTLEHIKDMRDLLGLELKEIREMVAAELERDRIRKQWQSDENLEWRLDALDKVEHSAQRELEMLEARLAGLEEMRHDLRDRMERYQRLRGELRAQLTARRADGRSTPQQTSAGG